jgi:hypothetical protein
MVGAWRSTRMKSPRLPSSREPTRSPSPTARAPSTVAMRSTFQAGMASGSWWRILWNRAVSFISLNMLWLLFPGA